MKKDIVEETQKRTWDICNAVDVKIEEKKRRLVSLFEANEVARRVVGTGGSYGVVVNGGLIGEVKQDIVSEWLH